jgi:hypothetical protein
MLDDIDKGFGLFAMQILSNMAKISVVAIPAWSGCTSPMPVLLISAKYFFFYNKWSLVLCIFCISLD